MQAGVLAAVLAWAGVAGAQEQYLGYHSGPLTNQPAMALTSRDLDVLSEAPAGLVLPANPGTPMLAVWKTPLAPGGQVLMAAVQTKPDGPYDRMVIDANANGRLDDDQAVEATDLRAFKDLQSCRFAGLKLKLPAADGPVTYHMDISFYKSGKLFRLRAQSACWYEGRIDLDGQPVDCLLLDSNVNGLFNDIDADPLKSDFLKLGDRPMGRVGKYVKVGDAFHQLTVAPDGSALTLTPAGDLAMGQVQATGVDVLCAAGANGVFFCDTREGPAKLPIGSYRVMTWLISREKGGAKFEATGTATKPIAFDVLADQAAVLDVGEPLLGSATLQATPNGEYQVSDPKLVGRSGERVTLTRNDKQVEAPRFKVTNEDGSYSQQLSFSYG